MEKIKVACFEFIMINYSCDMQKPLSIRKRLRISAGSIADRIAKILPSRTDGFRIILYHSVTESKKESDLEENTIDRKLFESQLDFLFFEKFNVISCEDAVKLLVNKKRFPPKTVAIAFDDGYLNICKNAMPALKKRNFPATLFISTDFLIKDGLKNGPYLSISEIVELRKTGLIDFGCHGKTHKMLSALDKESLDCEISDAKNTLKNITGSDICLFAYPYGHSASYNRKAIDKIRSAGFLGAFTTIFGFNGYARDPYLLCRNRISWLDEIPEFKKHLNGSYDWCETLEFLRKKRGS